MLLEYQFLKDNQRADFLFVQQLIVSNKKPSQRETKTLFLSAVPSEEEIKQKIQTFNHK